MLATDFVAGDIPCFLRTLKSVVSLLLGWPRFVWFLQYSCSPNKAFEKRTFTTLIVLLGNGHWLLTCYWAVLHSRAANETWR